MNRQKKKTAGGPARLTLDDFTGKQSVRATFRLPRQVIELLSVIAGQLGIKQKSLFDQLVENTSMLNAVAEEARRASGSIDTGGRRQKTFVISRSSLESLDDIAGRRQIPRDLLVELSIKRLIPVIEIELAKHKKRKILLQEMKAQLTEAKKLLAKAGGLLGENDRLYEMIASQVKMAEKNAATAEVLVEKGKPMEDW